MAKRTITLTGRPPVTIDEDAWPTIASAAEKEYDGEVEYQSHCTSNWYVGVRQHEDGRTLVYATYTYVTGWTRARDYAARRGVLLPAGTSAVDICAAIKEVCGDIAEAECDGDDAGRWPTLADDCIADMPAEQLA